MRRVVTAYQGAHGIKVSGRLDATTWAALTSDDLAPAYKSYTISTQDVAGPFTKTPAAMAERGKLRSLDYETMRESLAERFQISQGLLADLNRGRQFEAESNWWFRYWRSQFTGSGQAQVDPDRQVRAHALRAG